MGKNPAAVALGRRGGRVSGIKKGLAALTPERRREIARQGAAARAATRRKRGKGQP